MFSQAGEAVVDIAQAVEGAVAVVEVVEAAEACSRLK